AMTAQGVSSDVGAEYIAYQAEWLGALTQQAVNGITDGYNENVHKVRHFKEQIDVAARMLDWLEGSKLTTSQGDIRVQDAYTLRCISQIHGARFQLVT